MSPRTTPLDAVHRGLGATMTDFAGWAMPLRYGSEREEHLAVRSTAGLFDLSHMGEITLTGPGAALALDASLVGDFSRLAVGRARYTMICAADGGILDDLIVYRRREREYLVVANAANADTVLAELRARSAGFEAEVRDDRDGYALVAVQGPAAAGLLAGLADADLPSLRYYAGVEARVADLPVFLARTGYTGEDGFEMFTAAEHAEPLWRALTEAGAGVGLRPAGLASRDTLRLEAGMPLYGHELTARTTPFDAGLGRVVKFEKTGNGGEFVGREALKKAKEAGPSRGLAGLIATGRRVPRAGYPVLDTGTGSVVGTVTSGAPSPTLERPIAIASVPVELTTPGSALAVDIRGTVEPVEVVELPFYRRSS